jgi:glycosyltransferase involved in cell wall biosynthesis
MERTQLERCDACVVPSVYMGDVVRSFVSSRAPIRVISNLVTDRPSPVGKIAPAAVRVFIPSGGSLFKGAEVVPELVARIRSGFADRGEVEFFISGSLTAKQKEAILLASPKVHLTAPGHLPHSETLAHLAQSRVCVSPTWIENQSMALLEAKALGVPFAAFDVGGNREQLGKHDRVVVRGDVEALAHAALELLGRPFSTIDAWNNQAENESALDQWSELLLSLAE